MKRKSLSISQKGNLLDNIIYLKRNPSGSISKNIQAKTNNQQMAMVPIITFISMSFLRW